MDPPNVRPVWPTKNRTTECVNPLAGRLAALAGGELWSPRSGAAGALPVSVERTAGRDTAAPPRARLMIQLLTTDKPPNINVGNIVLNIARVWSHVSPLQIQQAGKLCVGYRDRAGRDGVCQEEGCERRPAVRGGAWHLRHDDDRRLSIRHHPLPPSFAHVRGQGGPGKNKFVNSDGQWL